MAIENGNGGLSAADVAAVVGNNGGGFGGMDFGGNGVWWMMILFLFVIMFGAGNWGNNSNGGGGGGMPYTVYNSVGNDVQRGFDQQAIMGGLNSLAASANNGFSSAEVARCNSTTTLLQAMNSNQNVTSQGMNSLAMSLQQCCCDNRAATADLKYTIAQENCADRQAVNDGVRDIQAQNAANTTQILNTVNEKYQGIQDKLCQLEMDGMRQNYENQIRDMQRQLDVAQSEIGSLRSAATTTAQTATILANNQAPTSALEQYLRPQANPAYIVPNPNGCNCNNGWNGCCA